MLILVGAGITFQPLVGIILNFNWHGQLIRGVPHYLLANYQIALAIVPISFLIALILSIFFIKETNCRDYGANT